MTSNTRLDAIDPHTYGLKAASACNLLIAQLEAASIPDEIRIIDQILDPQMRDRAMAAFINYTSTSDREALSQAIKGYEYLAAHLHLGKHMHALRMIDETHIKWISCLIIRHDRSLRSQSVLHVRDENYQPAVTSIIETLTESIQASNAPSAAIPAATCSI
jgi:hypothetical protein